MASNDKESDRAMRHIPEAAKRLTRTRCGFGCVLCGLPVYHYDHVIEFAEVQEHDPDNITLLCPNHHQDKTSNRLPIETVRNANMNPFNTSREKTSAHRWYFSGKPVEFYIGSTFLKSNMLNPKGFVAIMLDGEAILGFVEQDGDLLLNVMLRDQFGEPLMTVDRGEMRFSTHPVDIQMVGSDTQIVTQNSPPLKVRKNSSGLHISSGLFVGPRHTLRVFPDRLEVSSTGSDRVSNVIRGGGFGSESVGVAFGL